MQRRRITPYARNVAALILPGRAGTKDRKSKNDSGYAATA